MDGYICTKWSRQGLPELDVESTEIDDMIDLIPNVKKFLETVEQKKRKKTFSKIMGLLASGNYPFRNICYLFFLDTYEIRKRC